MESASSANASASKSVRGWKGLTSISAIFISLTEPIGFTSGVPVPKSFLFGSTLTESFNRALNPFPKAFLFSALILYSFCCRYGFTLQHPVFAHNLTRQVQIVNGSFAIRVVHDHRHAKAGRFTQTCITLYN